MLTQLYPEEPPVLRIEFLAGLIVFLFEAATPKETFPMFKI